MRDNGINVIIGQRKGGKGWKDAVTDGWVEGKTFSKTSRKRFKKATIVQYLLSDAGQKAQWPLVQKYLNKRTGVVFLAWIFNRLQRTDRYYSSEGRGRGPRGSERKRAYGPNEFSCRSGINSSFAIFQGRTGKARTRTIAVRDCDRFRLSFSDNV